MIDLPPISIETFDAIIENMPDEDRKYYNEFRPVHIPLVFQYIIEHLRKTECKTFDQFVNDAIRHYIFRMFKKRREERCQRHQKKLLEVSEESHETYAL